MIQAYLKNFVGSVSIDRVLLLKANGTADTLETFDKKIPETDGSVLTATLMATSQVTASLHPAKPAMATRVQLSIEPNQIKVAFASTYRGLGFLVLEQGGTRMASPVHIK